MPSFFGQHTDSKFSNDPLCKKMGSVSLGGEGCVQGSSPLVYLLVIVPPVIYVIANLPALLTYFN